MHGCASDEIKSVLSAAADFIAAGDFTHAKRGFNPSARTDLIEKALAEASAFFWKGNHILIEFPTMVSNARVRLQIDAHGFKLRCTVSGHFLPEIAVYH